MVTEGYSPAKKLSESSLTSLLQGAERGTSVRALRARRAP